MSDDNKGLIDLRLVVEVLRQHGRFDDEEGEVTNNLQDLIDSLATKEGAGVPVGWQVRGIGREDGPGEWRHADSADLEAYRNGPDMWELRPVFATPPAVVPAAPSYAVRTCEYCDDTGDVHGLDGEWRGVCICPAGVALSQTTPQAEHAAGKQVARNWIHGEAIDYLEVPDVQDESGINAHYSRDLVLQCIDAAIEAGKEQAGAVAWRDMATAPKDGTLLRLLVEFEHHATEDGEGPQPTIGSNTWDNHHDFDEWQFAGWNWEQDCYTQGIGKPVGWLPMLGTPLDTQVAAVVQPVAEWQYRTRPTWKGALGWTEWAKCSEGTAREFLRTNVRNDWVYEVRALYLAAPGAAIAAREQEGRRTPQDYAIEHAEYMATTAEGLIEAVNDLAKAEQERDDGSANPSDVDAAQETVSEYLGTLRNRIYEFRKRRDRALAPLKEAPSTPQGETLTGLHLAVIGRRHFGNPIPAEWYSAARELETALTQPTTVQQAEQTDVVRELPEVECPKCELKVLRNCGGNCPIPNRDGATLKGMQPGERKDGVA